MLLRRELTPRSGSTSMKLRRRIRQQDDLIRLKSLGQYDFEGEQRYFSVIIEGGLYFLHCAGEEGQKTASPLEMLPEVKG